MLETFGVYLHQIDPYMIKLWDGGPIRWYGMAYVVGFFLGYLMINRVVTKGRSPIKQAQVLDLVFSLSLGIVIGGRLGYALFYSPDFELFKFTSEPPYWGVLAFNHGGMASHGGVIGGVLTAIWWARRNKVSAKHVIDLMAFAFPPGIILGRLANFVNGELIGRVCDPGFRWAVKFPQEMWEWVGKKAVVTPEQAEAYREAVKYLPNANPNGLNITQIIEQMQKGNPDVIRIIEPVLTPRHPSQLYAAVLEGVVVGIVLVVAWYRPRKPLLIAGLCTVVYTIARITDEFFRMPDRDLREMEFAAIGLTRGQLLSAVMFLIGVGLMVWAMMSKEEKLGGWGGVEKAGDSVEEPEKAKTQS